MPVNFQEIQRQIREMGKGAQEREQRLSTLAESAVDTLYAWGEDVAALRAKVETATSYNSNLRCAVPVNEALTRGFPAPPRSGPQVLLAADGSQINPNRHEPVEFGVINVGTIRIAPGMGVAPREIVRSRLLYYDDLYTEGSPVGEEVVALMRDLAERQMLADLASEENGRVLTLTDGPLELFREPKDRPQFDVLFKDYLEALQRLARLDVVTAGYVDRPRADLVVRLLELAQMDELALERAGHSRPLHPITDLTLYEPLLKPGERSAIFAIQSTTARKFPGVTALHFFYLNVGRPDHPNLSRVEIPQWVACEPDAVDLLHSALVTQCLQMGTRPFPYALHRAHEVAVVGLDEKQQLTDMIMLELRRQGVHVSGGTFKQALKDLSGTRTRYLR